MKKAFALILSIVMMLSLAVPAFAAETAESRESLVSLTLDPSMESYTLTIPATIEIDITKETTEIPITLEDVTLVWNKRLSVSVSAANWTADAYETDKCSSYLINTEDAAKKIPYLLTSARCGSQLFSNNSIEVASAYWHDLSADGSEQEFRTDSGGLSFEILGEYPGAGTYTDTLTFTVELSRY